MKRLVFLLIFALPFMLAVDQTGKRLEIRNFKGLNTASGPMVIQPNEARVCNNIVLSNSYGTSADVGSLTKRKGYDSVSVRTGIDSLLGISGQKLSDGRGFLAFAADSTGVGYGNLYVTKYGTADLTQGNATELTSYWSIDQPTSFAMFYDVLYAVNGVQRGIYWDGKLVRPFPQYASGEPRIVPIRGDGISQYNFSGEYRYCLSANVYHGGSVKLRPSGMVTSPITVTSGRTALMEFSYPIGDTSLGSVDSARVFIYRTKANPEPLDNNDFFYRVGRADTVIHGSSFTNLMYVDSLPDSLLGPDSFNLASINTQVGSDSITSVTTTCRYGAPGLLRKTNASWQSGGMWKGAPTQKKFLAVVYVCTYIDTANVIESDTGRSLWVLSDTGNADTIRAMNSVTVRLPKASSAMKGVLRNVYRAHEFSIGHDSVYYTNRHYLNGIPIADRNVAYAVDTTYLSPFFLIAQTELTDTSILDFLPYDSLQRLKVYHRTPPPANLKQIFTFKGRLYGLAKSRLYRTYVDSANGWGAFEFQQFNEGDGDEGTVAWPTRTSIRYFKNGTNFNIYEDFTKTEISGYFGCIAPLSHVAGLGGHYYQTANGIVRENDGPTLERTFTQPLVSTQINSFRRMSPDIARKTVGIYSPFEQKAFFSNGDTTWIYDEQAGGWTTATGFTFAGATLYDTGSVISHKPFKTIYFYKHGGSTLFSYGTSELDDSIPVVVTYETGPLLTEYGNEQVRSIGVSVHNSNPNDRFQLRLLGPGGEILNSGGVITLDSISDPYIAKETGACLTAWYQRLRFYNTIPTAEWYSATIDGFDIFYITSEDWKFR